MLRILHCISYYTVAPYR